MLRDSLFYNATDEENFKAIFDGKWTVPNELSSSVDIILEKMFEITQVSKKF